MRDLCVNEYLEDQKLRASLDLMTWPVLFNAIDFRTVPFTRVFGRLADRCLYHSTNAWSQFITDLNGQVDAWSQVSEDAVIQTQDISSKYEVEAFFAAGTALFEKNFIRIDEPAKQSILGSSFSGYPEVLGSLRELFLAARAQFGAAEMIRHHSFHVNEAMRDRGYFAMIKRKNGGFVVTLPNIYDDTKGRPLDLVEVFLKTHQIIRPLLCQVRDALLTFYFLKNGPPTNNTYTWVKTPHGVFRAGLGPSGFSFLDAPAASAS